MYVSFPCFPLSPLTNFHQNHIKSLVRTTAKHVLQNGGAVRSLKYTGTRTLPNRMRRHQQWHTMGESVPKTPLLNFGWPMLTSFLKLCSYWTMHYDASPKLMNSLISQLRQDPRVIRWTTLKRGEAIKDVAGFRERTVGSEFDRLL